MGCFQGVFYFITLTETLTYYYIKRSQRHLLAAIEKNDLEALLGQCKTGGYQLIL